MGTGESLQRVYQGTNLLQIAFPLGGIGAGCVCLNGYGGLQDFSIRHVPETSALPDRHIALDAGFGLLHLPKAGVTRLLEGPFPPEKIYNLGLKSQGYNGGGFEGLPRFRDCTFEGEYPFGVVRLSDSSIPLQVTITGYNPFIPLDDVNSGIPCAILEYMLFNSGAEAVPYQFSYHLSHLAARASESSAFSKPIPGLGVYFWNGAQHASSVYGSAALGILAGEPLIKAHWFQGGWFDAMSLLWREVSTGSFQPTDGLGPGAQTARNGGSVMVAGELAPGETVRLPVVITWYFPNITASSAIGDLSQLNELQPAWHPFYTSLWRDAGDVLAYVQANFVELRERTLSFHDALFGSTLPAAVLDAVSANLAILKSPTVLRSASGEVWGWEGCFCDRGCCPGSCTHVWNYAQAFPHLFPALERTLREQELGASMDERGHVTFRSAPPGESVAHNFHAAADGQLGGIMKVYREWRISGDREWLAKLYPRVKRSMDFCIEQWDPRHTGLIEEPHHNTYDIEFWGPDGMCSSFYLGALAGMAALARDAGHPGDAEKYDTLAEVGAKAIDTRLFNGAYYQQEVAYRNLRDRSFLDMLGRIGDTPTTEERLLASEGPKYQYGSGCLSDGVFGAWLAKLCGLQSRQDQGKVRSHLGAIYQHNFKSSLWEHANVQRPGYALGGEAGLLLCTWPNGGKPTLPFVYSDEVWTGIEYQVASHMVAEGMVTEGLSLVEAVRSRYDGRTRNPWNEYECGNYYARAMASYALLIAFSGFSYAAPTRSLTLAPRLDIDPFGCFFSTASGWGTCTLYGGRLDVALLEGDLSVDTLRIIKGGREWILHPSLRVRAGEVQTIVFEDLGTGYP